MYALNVSGYKQVQKNMQPVDAHVSVRPPVIQTSPNTQTQTEACHLVIEGGGEGVHVDLRMTGD